MKMLNEMKKLLLILLIPFSLFSQSTLIFSEYGEGSSFNKWVEIYNPTFMSISLDEYRYNFCWNGCDSLEWEFSIPFDSGVVLMPNETYLLVHNNSDSILLSAANQTTNILSNGDDVIGLLNTSFNMIVDIIGVLDSADNISSWAVDGVIDATKDHTMIRKPDVCGGNIGDWSLSDGTNGSSQWIVGVIDDYSDLNTHTSNCLNTTAVEVLDPLKGELLKIIDLLGRETKGTKNEVLFYIYNDGTVEKNIIIE